MGDRRRDHEEQLDKYKLLKKSKPKDKLKSDKLKSDKHKPNKMKEIGDLDQLKSQLGEAGGKLVVVYFYRMLCNPCLRARPTVNKIADQDGVVVLKVDVDQHAEVAKEYGVAATPTFLLFKDQKRVAKVKGAAGLTDAVQEQKG